MTPAAQAARARAAKGEGEKLRDELIDAAEVLLLQTGDEDKVSIRALATAVGVTPPAVYLHFADKEALILEVCGRNFRRLDAAVLAADDHATDALDAYRRRAQAYVRFAVENPEPYRILFMTRRAMTADQLADPDNPGNIAFAHLVEIVQRCMDEGFLRPDDPVAVATGSWAVVHGLASLAISMPNFPLLGTEQLVDRVIESFTRGLAP